MTTEPPSLLKRIVTSTAGYSAAMLVGRMSSFFLLPVYTRYLTPADYGVLEIVDLAMFMLGTVIGMGLAGDALFYFHARLTSEQAKNRAVQTILFAATAIGVCLGLGAFFGASWLSDQLFRTQLYAPALRIAAFTFLFGPPVDALLCYLRAMERVTAFMVFSLVRLVLQIVLNVTLLVAFGFGLYAMLWSSFAGNFLMFVGLVIYCARLMEGWAGFDLAILRGVVTYSFPIGISSGAMLLIHYGDRFFLNMHCTLAEIGVYALAYKLGMAMSQLNLPFQMFWRSQVYSIVAGEDGDKVFVQVFLYFELVFICAAFGLTMFATPAVQLLSTTPFWGAAAFVPWLAGAYAARALEYQMQSALLVAAKTRKIMLSSVSGLVVCFAGYALLIPRYKVWGAVMATCLSFFTMLVLTFVMAQRQRKFPMPYAKLAAMPAIAALLILLRPMFIQGNGIAPLAISAAFSLSLPLLTLAMPGFGDERRLFAVVGRRIALRFAR